MQTEDTAKNKKSKEVFLSNLRSNVGKTGSPQQAKDPINLTMIRHWCEAMEDFNPNYLDTDYATQSPHGELVAPPAMLNAWTMPGLLRNQHGNDPQSGPLEMLDSAGYVGVVATNSEHVYHRYLRLGEQITATQKLLDVSEEKQTALGIGHFVTTETEYHTLEGEHIGSMFFRILKFIPGTGRGTGDQDSEGGEGGNTNAIGDKAAAKPKRPHPTMNANTAFFWDSLKQNELSIQKCGGCGEFQHPPGVRCHKCGSKDLSPEKVSGRGTLYSHCRVHYPPIPAFGEPPIVGLVELEEGPRVITNITDCQPEKVQIGMDLEVWFYREDEDMVLPLFRPARPPKNETTLTAEQLQPGLELPNCPVPITTTLIVSAAIASRDYQDVHHDPDIARLKGSPNIFMNILSSSGIVARYLSDWAGPDALFRNLKIRLGAPNYPDDCMVMSGEISEVTGNTATISFRGINSLGPHITGTAELELPKS